MKKAKKKQKRIKKRKLKAIAAKQYRSRGRINMSTKKIKNYDSNINNIDLNQKNNFYLVLSYNGEEIRD